MYYSYRTSGTEKMSLAQQLHACDRAVALGAARVLWLLARPAAAPVAAVTLAIHLASGKLRPRGRALRRAIATLELLAFGWAMRSTWRAWWVAACRARGGVYYWSHREARLARSHSRDDRRHRSSRSRSRSPRPSARPSDAESSLIERVVRTARLRSRLAAYERTVTPIVGGAWRTVKRRVVAGLGNGFTNGAEAPRFRRILLAVKDPVRGGETFATDWLHPEPARPAEARGIVILLPGVGGGSDVPYVHEAVRSVVRVGWAACVVNYRGLGSPASPSVGEIADLAMPYDAADLRVAIECAHRYAGARCVLAPDASPGAPRAKKTRAAGMPSAAPVPIVVLGFSLGAITVGRYFAREGARVPPHVVGAVAVSGAFKLDFVSWPAYRDFWQQMIVPSLVADLLRRYREQLLLFLSPAEVAAAAASCDYESLVERILLPLAAHARAARRARGATSASLPPAPLTFAEFQARGESTAAEIASIDRPFLFLASLDDPLLPVPPSAKPTAVSEAYHTAWGQARPQA